MSGDWIKMRGNLWDDPRVAAICDATDSSEACVIGALYWLWASADQHTEDGVMPGLSLRQIDRKTGLSGFGAAVVAVGWLSEVDCGVRIDRFEEHNGSSAKRRSIDAKRKQGVRKSSACYADNIRTENGHDVELEKELEIEKEEEQENSPAVAAEPVPAKPRKTKRAEITLTEFSRQCEEAGEQVIPAGDAVFTYAEKTGLPVEFVALAWSWFKGRYGAGGDSERKRYADWRAAFRNAVKGNWPKYWGVSSSGEVYLTATGKLAEREAQA
jgi:hypothetical protein